jgi:hypothetical protein
MGRSLKDIARYRTLNSGTKLGNHAGHVPEKTDMRARASLSNTYLTQAAKAKPAVRFLPMTVASLLLSGKAVADGTIQPGVIEKAKESDRLRKKRRPPSK